MTSVDVVRGDEEEGEVRQVLEAFLGAVRARDLESVMSFYQPNVVAFDVVPPLQYKGVQAYRQPWEIAFSQLTHIESEMRDLNVVVSRDVAFCYALVHMKSNIGDHWIRWTWCMRKTKGRWFIAHEHVSVPADPRSDQSLLDLLP